MSPAGRCPPRNGNSPRAATNAPATRNTTPNHCGLRNGCSLPGAPIGTVLALLRTGGVQTLPSDLLIGVVLFALAVIVLGLAPHPRFTREILSVAVPEIERRAAAQHAEPPAVAPAPGQLTG